MSLLLSISQGSGKRKSKKRNEKAKKKRLRLNDPNETVDVVSEEKNAKKLNAVRKSYVEENTY